MGLYRVLGVGSKLLKRGLYRDYRGDHYSVY